MNHIIKLIVIAVAVVAAIPSFAVTDREMEQARTMAAKHYLRYANNGSDYLDKLNPTTMSDLTKSLKAKEQENIKSFNAVAVPKDYASWDKAKLVEYWSNTFFKSSGLKEDGKKCLGILAGNLGKIQVSAKSPEPPATEKKTEEGSPAASEGTPAATGSQPAPAPELSNTSDVSDNADASVAVDDAEALASGDSMEEERPRKSSGTGWYVAILIILVGVVVWLVMYAQKSMKETGAVMSANKSGEKEIREVKKSAKEEINKLREQYAASISAKNEEIRELREKCETLQSKVQELRQELDRKDTEHHQATAPVREQTPKGEPSRQTVLPAVVYLGYVNQRGLFVKASRSLNAESSVYRMDIPDGVHGTFKVVTDASILDRLLSDPSQWLEGGCEIENPEDADIATEIVNLTPGQAVFADNSCRVVKKARIKFI